MAGVARRAKELSEEFTKNGYSVTVVTSYPRDFRSMPGYSSKEYEIINNVKVVRVKTIFHVGENTIFRLLSYFLYVIRCIIYISRNHHRYDIILSMAPLPPAIAGALGRKLYNKYHHFDVPDILPDLGISAGMIKNRIIIKFLFFIEKWVYDNSDSISAITYGQIKNIINKGVKPEKIHYMPDWIDSNYFHENLFKYKSKIKKILHYPNKTLITFVGNIGALQNPNVFLLLMNSLNKDHKNKFQFLFVGDGIMLKSLKKESKELNLNNVSFIGRVERKYIPAYMNLSDILVANYLSNKYLDICIPGKLYEYGVSNRPIIMGSRGEAKKLIEKYNLGYGVNPSDIDSFKKAVIDISSGAYKHQPKLDEFINHFSLGKIANNYTGLLSKLFVNS
tara:strand:- start:17130 stop:18305 length:1176 start_codon:yes stop_codon:yes gene_type:complete